MTLGVILPRGQYDAPCRDLGGPTWSAIPERAEEATYAEIGRLYAARVEELKNMGAEIEQKFTVLASQALGNNSESVLRLMSERFEKHKVAADRDLEARQKAIETLVRPISESFSKFEHKIGELEKYRQGAYEAITEQVKNLAEGQTGLRSETTRLVHALRQPKTRGRWGEFQLRNVLEMAGMTEHVDFVGGIEVGWNSSARMSAGHC